MMLHVHPVNPQKRLVDQLAEGLRKGKVYILPTDTVYAIVCLLDHPRSINELYKLKNIPEKQPLSLLCRDVAMAATYASGIPNSVFRFMKAKLPGPYTFILKANRIMDRRGTGGAGKKKTVGIRIVNSPLHQMLMEQLDVPLVSTSITLEGEFSTDPEELELQYGKKLEAVVDGGIRYHEFSTVLDCSGDGIVLLREGIGQVDDLELAEPEG